MDETGVVGELNGAEERVPFGGRETDVHEQAGHCVSTRYMLFIVQVICILCITYHPHITYTCMCAIHIIYVTIINSTVAIIAAEGPGPTLSLHAQWEGPSSHAGHRPGVKGSVARLLRAPRPVFCWSTPVPLFHSRLMVGVPQWMGEPCGGQSFSSPLGAPW